MLLDPLPSALDFLERRNRLPFFTPPPAIKLMLCRSAAVPVNHWFCSSLNEARSFVSSSASAVARFAAATRADISAFSSFRRAADSSPDVVKGLIGYSAVPWMSGVSSMSPRPPSDVSALTMSLSSSPGDDDDERPSVDPPSGIEPSFVFGAVCDSVRGCV